MHEPRLTPAEKDLVREIATDGMWRAFLELVTGRLPIASMIQVSPTPRERYRFAVADRYRRLLAARATKQHLIETVTRYFDHEPTDEEAEVLVGFAKRFGVERLEMVLMLPSELELIDDA